MSPRLVGALLVLTVVAVAISAPAVGGRRTAGTAVMVELPRDPQVGDCLLDLPAALGTPSPQTQHPTPDHTAATAEWRHLSLEPLGLAVVPCDDRPIAGEVAAVAAATTDPVTHRLRAPNGPDCRTAALTYAGLVPTQGRFGLPGSPVDDPVTWNFSIDLRSSWVLPSAIMQARGRTWAACVIAPRDDVAYRGRVAGAFDGGTLPDEFGTCWDTRSVSAAIERVDCRAAHLAELIAAGVVADRNTITAADLMASCQQLAGRVVGRQDPTAGGRLVVKISPERLRESSVVRPVSVLCYVVAPDRPLDATLVGLGEQPIPYAS